MDKMREEFEAWAGSTGFTLKPNAFSNGDYAMGYGWQEWNAWQASRAALCVELPEIVSCSDSSCLLGYINAVDDVKECLDLAGVSYK